MEKIIKVQKINYEDIIKIANLLDSMSTFGFDFSLTGTKYIYEIFDNNLEYFQNFLQLFALRMSTLADRHNIKQKSLNRDVRWSIFNKEIN